MMHSGVVAFLCKKTDFNLFLYPVSYPRVKADRTMGVPIRSLQTSRTAGLLKTSPNLGAYFGNVRSVLEYGCVIWGGDALTPKGLILSNINFYLGYRRYYQQSRPAHLTSYHDLLHHFRFCFPLHVPQRRTMVGPALLLHVPSDPFHAAPYGFRASARNCVKQSCVAYRNQCD